MPEKISVRELNNPKYSDGGGTVHVVAFNVHGRLTPAKPCVAYSPERLSTGSSAFLVARMLMSSALSVVPDCRTSGRLVIASLMASSKEIFSTSGGATSAVSVGIISTLRRTGPAGSLEIKFNRVS